MFWFECVMHELIQIISHTIGNYGNKKSDFALENLSR